MRIRSNDVHEQTFSTTFRGFEPVEVDGFLNRVADELDRLADEIQTLEAEQAVLQTQLEEEREARRIVESSMSQAEHLKVALMDKAKDEARVTLHQARLVAERVVAEAEEHASTMRNDVERLRQKRIAFLAELSGISHGLAEWVEGIKTKPAKPAEISTLFSDALADELDPEMPDLSVPDPAVEQQVAKSQLAQISPVAPATPDIESVETAELPDPDEPAAANGASFQLVTSEGLDEAMDSVTEPDRADEDDEEQPAPDSIYKPIKRDDEEPA